MILGKSNENEIIIRAGLEAGDDIYLVPDEGAEDYSITKLDTSIVNHFKRLDDAAKGKPEEKEEEMTPEEIREMLKNMSQEERMKYMQEHPEVMQKMGGGKGKRPGGKPGGGK